MRLLSLIIVMICCIASSNAKMALKHLDTANGLPSNKINVIHRSSDGFIWIGTSAGLCRYDGYTCKVYPMPDSMASTFYYTDVEAMGEDTHGRLWIRSGSAHAVYEPAADRLTADIASILEPYGIKGMPEYIYVAPDHTMWLHILGNGLFRLAPGADKAEKAVDSAFAGAQITGISTSPHGIMTVDRRGIIRIIDRRTLKTIRRDKSIAGMLPGGNTYVFTVTCDKEGLAWIYNNEDLWLYDIDNARWLSDRLPDQGKRQLVKAITGDRAGNLYIGRDHRGLEEIVKGDKITFRRVETDVEQSINTVTSLHEDTDGTLWIGTYKKGVFSHSPGANRFELVSFPDVNCILPSRTPDKVWIGTDADGLMLWHPSTGQSETFRNPSDGNTPSAITSLLELPDGSLLVGSFSRGLRRFAGGTFIPVDTRSRIDYFYSWALAEMADKRLCIGTLGGGFAIADPNTFKAVCYDTSNSELPSDYILAIATATDGKIYLATSQGVAVFDATSEKISTVSELYGLTVNDITIDSRGLVWAATVRGVKIYDPRRQRIYNPGGTSDNPGAGFMLGLCEDRNGDIWSSRGGSLVRFHLHFNGKTGEVDCSTRIYDSADGLPRCDFNQRSLALLPSGTMVAGHLYGISMFSPAMINDNSNLPRVIFTGLMLGSKPVAVGEEVDGRVPLARSPNHGGCLELGPGNTSFTISLATDNYVHPDKTTYYYMLEGFDKDWITAPSSTNHVSYTNLPAGSYRLLVKAANSDGYVSAEPAALAVTVRPPFYASVYAMILYVILLIAASWGIYHMIRRRFKLRREQDILAKQEELNQMKFKFYTNVSHELRTPLTLIVAPLEKMIKETTDEHQLGRLNIMRKNAARLLMLVNQLLDFRKNEMTGLTLQLSDGELIGFVRDVCNTFTDLSERKNISLDFHCELHEINCRFDDGKLTRAIINLLGNAFKFTPEGGRVCVSISRTPDNRGITISVADTGIGISDRDKAHIFERFYQAENRPKDSSMTGNGIGLNMAYEYVRLHNGTITVTDNPGGGSVFTINMPLLSCETAAHPEIDTINTGASESEHPSPASPLSLSENTATAATLTPSADENTVIVDKPTALIVDDSRDMLDFLRDGLRHDFHIITASNGDEALHLLSSIRPSIVLTDLMMPGTDGLELCRRMKSDPAHSSTPVIILTAKHDMDTKFEGLTTGADDYITKPFNIDLLLLKMKKLVSLTRKNGSSLINPDPGSIKITPLDEKIVEKAMKYVVNNIRRTDLSVEELSAQLGMSRVHLYKKLKATTGKTPVEFIRLIRLKRGAQLLRESQLNVSEIAFQLGFNNPKYFSKYFKEEFGVLPSVYQEHEGKETNYPV